MSPGHAASAAHVWVDARFASADTLPALLGAAARAGADHAEVIGEAGQHGTPATREALGALLDAAEAAGARLIVWLRGGRLHADALSVLGEVFERYPDSVLGYGDWSGPAGRIRPPAYSPLRLLEHDYLGPVVAFPPASLRELLAGASDEPGSEVDALDLVLAFDGAPAAAVTVPRTLAALASQPESQRRANDDRALRSVRRRLRETGASVEPRAEGVRRVRFAVQGRPLVSVIIPTRGGSATVAGRERVLVVEAVRGIVERTAYDNVELVVVADEQTPQPVVDALAELAGDRLRLVRFTGPFNFSEKVNAGAVAARGEHLLLLNDDIEIVHPDWLERMVALVQRPGVGAVGALLYFEDSTIQHAGHLYEHGQAGHIAIGWHGGQRDPLHTLEVVRETSGATAACLLVPAEVFAEVGGFCTLLPGNYNDADFCMKLRAGGRSVVVTPDARLYHFESKTRDATVLRSEIATLRRRWVRQAQVDVYFRS